MLAELVGRGCANDLINSVLKSAEKEPPRRVSKLVSVVTKY